MRREAGAGRGGEMQSGERTGEAKEGGRGRRMGRLEGETPEEREWGAKGEGRGLREGSRVGRAGLREGLAAAESVLHFNF